MQFRFLTKFACALAVGVLSVGACSSDDSGNKASNSTAPESTTPDPTPTPTTEATEATAPAATGTKVTVRAFDIGFEDKKLTAPAGSIEVKYVNNGGILHRLTIDGKTGLKLEVKKKGDVDSGKIDLAAGTYTYLCDIPGHRAAGMEGTLTVT